MKLKIFDFLGKSIQHMYDHMDFITMSSAELRKFFKDIFLNVDCYINTTSRIKSPDSIREKLLRNNYYYIYSDYKDAIENLPDLIGIRIECRFIDDEKKIFNIIENDFNIKTENGFYKSKLNSNIELQLDEKQPKIQKNGFEIYKIDGKYVIDKMHFINFELQIKSLVNIFWGEIDHSVLYKELNSRKIA